MYAYNEPTRTSRHSIKSFSSHAPVVQRYLTFQDNGKIYNTTNDYSAVCGLTYPNHDLYVKSILDVHTTGTDSMINFAASHRKTFLPPLGTYVKVAPRWKPELKVTRPQVIEKIKEDFGDSSPAPSPKLKIIDRIARHKETLKKYIIQSYYRFGSVNSIIKDLYFEYKPVHILLTQFITGTLDAEFPEDMSQADIAIMKKEPSQAIDKTMLTNRLQSVLNSYEETPPTVFFDDAVIRPGIITELNIILQCLNRLQTQPTKAEYRKAYLERQVSRQNMNQIVLPRGCDLVADVLGSADSDAESPIMLFQIEGKSAHHFSTSIFQSGGDFVTMEGFADPAFPFYDDSWEFYMHGDIEPSHQKAFQKYTEIRYSFFPEFQKGIQGTHVSPVRRAERYKQSRFYHQDTFLSAAIPSNE